MIAELQARSHKCHLMPGGVSHLEVFSNLAKQTRNMRLLGSRSLLKCQIKGFGPSLQCLLLLQSLFQEAKVYIYIYNILRYLIKRWWLKRKLLSRSKFIMVRDHMGSSLGATQIHQSMVYLRCFQGPIFTANASDLPYSGWALSRQAAVNTRCQVKLNLATPCLLCRGLHEYP